jgi:hypothetical protein
VVHEQTERQEDEDELQGVEQHSAAESVTV